MDCINTELVITNFIYKKQNHNLYSIFLIYRVKNKWGSKIQKWPVHQLVNLYAQQMAWIVQVIEVALECMFLRVKMLKCMEWHWSVAILWTNI